MLGVLGGGQLGRYFVMAAHELGYRVMVLDPDRDSPAGRIADAHLVAGYEDIHAIERMAAACAAITTEFENVPADSLTYLARSLPVRPGAEVLRICQDRSAEKGFLRSHGFPHAPYADIRGAADIERVQDCLFPGILKVARGGYDGKGQTRVRGRAEALAAYRRLKDERCVLERRMDLDGEISVVLARDEAGRIGCFPASENRHRRGILDISMAPAPGDLGAEAGEIAEGIAERMGYVGTLGVEFFVVAGRLYVNEIAPRPHNSGHYTLDACVTSQFEQQVRTLCGIPLGDTRAHCFALMVNLPGDLWYPDGAAGQEQEPDWGKLLGLPNLKLHLYGKHRARPGRKMGHFTLLGTDPNALRETAMAARAALGIRDE
jgi:5-(carboxyamino)imidazole ribonucleotide synthase